MRQWGKAAVVAGLAGALVLVAGTATGIECRHPQGNLVMNPMGDVRGTGKANVADALCVVMASLSFGTASAPPSCLAPAFAAGGWAALDVNCDGVVNVADVTLVQHYALGIPIDAALDQTGDGCPDQCAPCVEVGARSCLIAGDCVPEGASAPMDPCAVCSPDDTASAWASLPDGTACDDGAPCTAGSVCSGGQCGGGAPVVCAPTDACHEAGPCDPATGTCAQTERTCDDGDPATADTCDPAVGCVFVPLSAPTPGEIASAPSSYACSGSHSDGLSGDCGAAFDGIASSNNYWHSPYGAYDATGAATSEGAWVQANYASPVVLGGARFVNLSANGHARDVVVEGANAPSGPWTLLHTASSLPHSQSDWVELTFSNGTAYFHYRVRVVGVHVPALDGQSSSWVKLGELELIHGTPSPTAPVYPAAAACSSEHLDGQSGACDAAFDGQSAHPNFWHSAYGHYSGGEAVDGVGQWARADFGGGVALSRVRFINTSANGHARDVVVEAGHTEQGPWVELAAASDVPHSQAWIELEWGSPGLYRYYRLRAPRVHVPALDGQGSVWVKFSEIEFSAGAPTTQALSTLDVACSSVHLDNVSGACAAGADGIVAGNNYWHASYHRFGAGGHATAGGEWIRLDLGAPYAPESVRFINQSANGHVRDMVLEASLDAQGPWTLLHTATDLAHSSSAWMTMPVSEGSCFRYYRLRATRVHQPSLDGQTPSWAKLTEVEVIGDAATAACEPGAAPPSGPPVSSTCSTVLSGSDCARAFDGSTSTHWHSEYHRYDANGDGVSPGGEWLIADFGAGQSIAVSQVSFVNVTNNGHVRDVVVEGADAQAGPWTQVGAASNVGASKDWKTVSVSAPSGWRYYRVRFPRNYYNGPFDQQNHSWIKISALEFD